MISTTRIGEQPCFGQRPGSAPDRQGAVTEEFITKDEVARRLKKTPRTVENWQRRGLIPFVKAGHSVLYDWPAVEARLRGPNSEVRGRRSVVSSQQGRGLSRLPAESNNQKPTAAEPPSQ